MSIPAENPEDAAAAREADESFKEAGKKADFGAGAESLRSALGGIGQRNPEEATQVKQAVQSTEAQDPDNNPHLDFSAFDLTPAGAGDNTLVGSAGKDKLASGKETGGETPVEEKPKSEIPETNSKNPEVGDVPKPDSENPERKETIDTNKEGEYTPLLIDFAKTGKLTPDELTTVLQANITADNFNETIEGLNISPQAQAGITKSLSYLNSEGHQKQARDAITKDFPNMIGEEFIDPKGGNELLSPHAEAALNNVARHCICNTDADPSQKEADLRRALSMASSAVSIKGGGLISPQDEFAFGENKNTISNPNASLMDQFNALTKNTELASNSTGIKSKSRTEMTTGDEVEDTTLDDIINKAELGPEFEIAQEALRDAQEGNNAEEIARAQAEITQIVEKAAKTTNTPLGNLVNIAMEVGGNESRETSTKTP